MPTETNPATGKKYPVINCRCCGQSHYIVFDANTERATCFHCQQEVYIFRVTRPTPPLPKQLTDLFNNIDPDKVAAYVEGRQAELDKEKAILEAIAQGKPLDASEDFWLDLTEGAGRLIFHQDAVMSSTTESLLTELRKD